MQTTTYGYKIPETGEKGSLFFPALEDNITRVDAHTHDGLDSAVLPVTSMVATMQTISSGSWVDQGDGTYRQSVTLPDSMLYDEHQIEFRTSDGDRVYPSVEKINSTSYYVYINDNTVTLKAIYG